MKKLSLIVVLMLVVFSGSVFAQTKIAVIDLEGAMNQTKAGAKANVELQADFNKAKERAQKLATEMEGIQKDVEAQRSVLSQDAIQKKLADIQKKKVELERLEKDTQDELQRKQMQFVGSIVQEMRTIITTYAKEQNIELVIEAKESGTIYANPALDITEAIVKRFDAQWKQK